MTVHYRTSQHYQENVFIEGSRPQYLEDLHTEAQEGLKILQQEGLYKHIHSYCRHLLVFTCEIYKRYHNHADSGGYWHFKMYLLFLYVISDKDTVYMIMDGVPLYLDSDYSDLSIWFEQNTRMELTFQTMRALL